MEFLRSNTAVIVAVGPFFDRTDGVTIETALTITNERITLVAETDAGSAPTLILDNIPGATAATANDLNYITGGDNGMMQLELAAADVNRVGRMKLSITDAANHVPVFHSYFVLPAVIYDWLTAGVAPLSPTVAGRTLDVSAGGEAGLDWANIGSPTTAQNLSATNIDVDQVVASVSGAVGSVTGAVGSVTGAVGSVTGAVGSVTGAVGSVTGLTAATVHADLDDIQTQIGAAGAGLTAIPWNAAWDAEVQSEVDDALNTAIAELGVATPTATPTIRTAIMLLYMALRNRLVVQTSGVDAIELHNDAGVMIASKAITDDGADYVEAEMV